MSRRSSCASDPHTGHVPIRFRGSPIPPMFQYVSADPPYHPQAPKNPTPVSPRPAFRPRKSRANPVPASSQDLRIRPPHIPNTQIHVRTCTAMVTCLRAQSRRDQRPAYADPCIKPTYSNSLRRRGGHGVASRRGDATSATASTPGGPIPVMVRPEGRTCSRA